MAHFELRFGSACDGDSSECDVRWREQALLLLRLLLSCIVSAAVMVRLIIWIYLNRGTSQSDNLPEKSNKKRKHDEDSDLIETFKFLWHH